MIWFKIAGLHCTLHAVPSFVASLCSHFTRVFFLSSAVYVVLEVSNLPMVLCGVVTA